MGMAIGTPTRAKSTLKAKLDTPREKIRARNPHMAPAPPGGAHPTPQVRRRPAARFAHTPGMRCTQSWGVAPCVPRACALTSESQPHSNASTRHDGVFTLLGAQAVKWRKELLLNVDVDLRISCRNRAGLRAQASQRGCS